MTRTALSRTRALLCLTPVMAIKVYKPSEVNVKNCQNGMCFLEMKLSLSFMHLKVENHRMGKKHNPGLER